MRPLTRRTSNSYRPPGPFRRTLRVSNGPATLRRHGDRDAPTIQFLSGHAERSIRKRMVERTHRNVWSPGCTHRYGLVEHARARPRDGVNDPRTGSGGSGNALCLGRRGLHNDVGHHDGGNDVPYDLSNRSLASIAGSRARRGGFRDRLVRSRVHGHLDLDRLRSACDSPRDPCSWTL